MPEHHSTNAYQANQPNLLLIESVAAWGGQSNTSRAIMTIQMGS